MTSLDIGCGPAPDLPPDGLRVGLDINLASLRKSREQYPGIHLVCAAAEQLPFRDDTFDLVVSRLALPYTDLTRSIPEIGRVLKPQGQARLNLHHLGFAWRDLVRRVRLGPRALLGGVWTILNGFVFHFCGRTLRLPRTTRFYDSFQTYSSMRRILQANGFSGRVVETYSIQAEKGTKPHLTRLDDLAEDAEFIEVERAS